MGRSAGETDHFQGVVSALEVSDGHFLLWVDPVASLITPPQGGSLLTVPLEMTLFLLTRNMHFRPITIYPALAQNGQPQRFLDIPALRTEDAQGPLKYRDKLSQEGFPSLFEVPSHEGLSGISSTCMLYGFDS